MKVLQTINSLSSGGAEVFATGLAIALKSMGVDVEIFTYCGAIDEKGKQLEAELLQAGVKHHSPKLRKNLLKPIVPFYLAHTIHRIRPDICHSHLEQSDFFLAIAEKLTLQKFSKVRTIHNVFASRTVTPKIHEWLRTTFDSNIACGPAVKIQYPYLRPTDLIINNGIDLSKIQRKINIEVIREQLHLSPSEKLLIHIGALSLRDNKLQKAQDIIVNAMAKTTGKDYIVAFLGDGDQRPLIEKMAQDLSVYSRCRFMGRVTNVADYIYAADAVLMPSRFEGLSIGCIEAVCAGRPVIASDIAAFSPFEKLSTLFVEPESAVELAKAIDLLTWNLDALKQAAIENQTAYRNEFDINSVATRYLTHYQDLLYKLELNRKDEKT